MQIHTQVARLSAGLLTALYLTFLTGCGALGLGTPSPDDAEYRSGFTPAIHADALISEGRFDEALRVVIDSQDSLWLKKKNARRLFKFIEENQESPVVQELTSLFDKQKPLINEDWAQGRELLAQGNGIVKLARRAGATRSDWVKSFIQDYERYRGYWLYETPAVVASCNDQEFAECFRGFPVEFGTISGADRQKIIASVLKDIQLTDDAISAFSQYLKITEGLFSVFFKTGRQDKPVVQLNWISVGDFPEESQLPTISEAFGSSEKISYENFELSEGRFSLFGLVISDRAEINHQERKTIESEFISSRQSRPNPEYQRIRMELEQAQFTARQAQQSLANAQGAFSIGFYRGQAAGAQIKANRLYQKLRGTQPTIVEEIYSPYTYSKERYEIERNLQWRIYIVDQELDEVWGTDVSHNHPVRFSISRDVHSSDARASNGPSANQAMQKVYGSGPEISLHDIFANKTEFFLIKGGNLATEVENALYGLKKENFIYLNASNFQAEQRLPAAQTRTRSIGPNDGLTGGFWLQEKSSNGAILTLSDGSVWEVDAMDRIFTMLWLPTTEIMVVESDFGYLLINADDGEKAAAVFVGYR